MFHNWRASKDGLAKHCKACVQENTKKWYEENKQRLAEERQSLGLNNSSIDIEKMIKEIFDFNVQPCIWLQSKEIALMLDLDFDPKITTSIGIAATKMGLQKRRTSASRMILMPPPLAPNTGVQSTHG
jgi:hypothetical protein